MPILSTKTESDNSGLSGRSSLRIKWDHFVDALGEHFSEKRLENRNRILILILTALGLTFLILPSQNLLFTTYKAGEVALSDIRATQDYLIEDRRLTEIKRSEAETVAPYIYTLNNTASQELIDSFERGLNTVRSNSSARTPDSKIKAQMHEALGTEINNSEWHALLKLKDNPSLMMEVARVARKHYVKSIVADIRLYMNDLKHGIILLDGQTGQIIGTGDDKQQVVDIDKAKSSVERIRLKEISTPLEEETISWLITKMLKPELVFSRELTEEKKKAAASSVMPVLFQIKRGEMVVRLGDRITPGQEYKLNKIKESRRVVNKIVTGLGIFILVSALLYFPYRFAIKNIRKFHPGNKEIFLLALVALFVFLLLKLGLIFSTSVGGLIQGLVSADLYYILPFAVAPMVVRIILNSEVALVFCAMTSPLLGLMFDNSFPVAIYALLGGVVGAHGVRQCKERGILYSAGVKISIVNIIMAMAFQIQADNFISVQTLYCLLFAAAGGIVNAVIASGVIPLIENFFCYTTDIKLLEFANLNTPVLKELLFRAPGTYHHSVLVGNLAEAAAESINANPLLARVAAYYHDIGKISKPHYFVENQMGGENRHDKLSPSMSALVLIAHVKEGAELARENRLGQPIIDMIRQSHGTALIKYFYGKACEQSASEQVIDENEYRYPGPKPQTREAGLVLLADSVEAASRTLADPSPARIRGMVQKIINNIFIDGQLDECELTLSNLHEIAKSFITVLSGMYHHRIDYPEPAYKEKDKANGRKKSEHNGEQQAAQTPGESEKNKGGGTEDIKRLGIARM